MLQAGYTGNLKRGSFLFPGFICDCLLFTKELFNVPQNDNYYTSSIVSAARLLNGLITRCNGKSRMISLVDARFAEWTSGVDTRESMISIFSHIHDTPYLFIVSNPDHKTSPEQLLKAGKWSCGPKHHLLAEMYRKLNLCVVFATIVFSWNDPDLLYPSELRKQALRLPAAYHLSCRFRSGAAGYWWMQRGISLLAGLASRLMNTGRVF